MRFVPSMKISLSLALIALAAVSAAPASAQVVTPSAFAATEAPAAQFAITQIIALTYEVQYSATQLAGLSIGQTITGLQFRLNTGETPQTLTYNSYSVQLSQAARAITGMSSTFTANQFNPITVFNGPLTLPAGSQPSSGSPNAFGPTITFTTNYTYLGGDLVLLIRHSDSNTGTGNGVGLDAASTLATDTGYQAVSSQGQSTDSGNVGGNVLVTRLITGATAAPEPGSLAFLALAGLPVVGLIRRKRK